MGFLFVQRQTASSGIKNRPPERADIRKETNMVETIIVSALVSIITARITAAICLLSLEKHSDAMLELSKKFFAGLLATLSKRS